MKRLISKKVEMPYEEKMQLIRKFAPVVYLHADEKYFPSSVDWYISRTRLMFGNEQILETGGVSSTNLLQQKKGDKFSNANEIGEDRFTFYLDIKENKEITQQGDTSQYGHWPCYAQVRENTDGNIEIQYWFFYPYNESIANVQGNYIRELFEKATWFHAGVHEGDWEHTTVRLNKDRTSVESTCYDAHGNGTWIPSINCLTNIAWGNSVKYDKGDVSPCVAMTNAGSVIEVHSDGHNLYYNYGMLSGYKIKWYGESNGAACGTKYDIGSKPSIAVNDNGDVVEMHKCRDSGNLVYTIGRLGTNHIDFYSPVKYDTGDTSPSVALSNNRIVVEVHSDGHNLYYNVGQLINDKIQWNAQNKSAKGTNYDKGSKPYVAINDSGLVIEMHKCKASDEIVYNIGRINGYQINFFSCVKFDHADTSPFVTLSNDGTFIEVHRDGHSLYYNRGKVVNDTVIFGDEPSGIRNYDVGYNPSIALNDNGFIVEMHKCRDSNELVYNAGTLLATPVPVIYSAKFSHASYNDLGTQGRSSFFASVFCSDHTGKGHRWYLENNLVLLENDPVQDKNNQWNCFAGRWGGSFAEPINKDAWYMVDGSPIAIYADLDKEIQTSSPITPSYKKCWLSD